MVWHPCMRKSHTVWANHTGFPFPTKLPFEVRSCEVDWKKKLIWNSDLDSLILLNFAGKKFLPPKQNHYLLSGNFHRAGYLQINLAPQANRGRS